MGRECWFFFIQSNPLDREELTNRTVERLHEGACAERGTEREVNILQDLNVLFFLDTKHLNNIINRTNNVAL